MRSKVFSIITFIFLLVWCFPPVNILFPVGGALKLAIFEIIAVLLYPNLLRKRTIVMMFVYGIMMSVYYILGNAYFTTFADVIVPFLSMLAGLIIVEYSLAYDSDYKYTRMVVCVVITCNVIMAVISIPQLLVNPMLLRRGSNEAIEGGVGYYWSTNYHTLHGLPFLIAPMFFLCRKLYKINKKLFVLWLVSIVIIVILLVLGNAVMSFLLTIIMVLMGLFFAYEHFTSRNVTKMVVVGVISVFLLSPTVMVPIIESVQKVLNVDSFNYKRLDEIKYSMIYGESEGDLEARHNLYARSQDLFWESPIVGTTNPELISHHTWIWDRLALYGIIFIIPLVLLFVFHVKKVYRNLEHSRVTYSFGVATYLLMLYLKNDFGIITWLYAFAVLPLLCRYIDAEIENNYINKIR